MIELVQSQLTDPFRIAMLIALVYVWDRNRRGQASLLPLAAGYVFVAVLLALTTGSAGGALGQQVPGILAGLISNAIILAVVLAAWAVWQRVRRR